MKKLISVFLSILLIASLSVVGFAASEGPQIILQPQSPNYPQYSVAIYTVKASGTNLSATWYMDWLGSTYTISNIGSSMQAWEPFAGEAYGAKKLDDNTFAFIFEGIEYDLDGAYIWCVIEDGHYDVASQKVRISVGNPNSPPVILDIPAQLTVEQGAEAEIRCVAQAPGETQLSFLWYETDTGRMEDMRAVNRGTETSDYLFCDTSVVGTRYYLCKVDTSEGGLAYSSIVPVTVTEKTYIPDPPAIQTNTIPGAEVNKPYSAKISCTDPNAEFSLYYNPGGANDFEKTGLVLDKNGTISGTPKAPGSFSFCICAAGAGGEDYMVYTLVVKEAQVENTVPTTPPTEAPTLPATTAPAQTTPAATTPVPTSEAPTQETKAPSDIKVPSETKPAAQKPGNGTDADEGIPWWTLVLVGLAGVGAGVVTTVILVRKSSK